MIDFLRYLKKGICTPAAALLIVSLAAGSAFAQTAPAADAGAANAEANAATGTDPSRQVVISDQDVDGDINVTDPDVHVVINGGSHTINGSVQINGAGDRFVVEFDKELGHGHVQVNGVLTLGPDNAPILGLDLSKVSLRPGAKFVIVDADEVVGEFNGLANGSTLRIGGYTIRIIYAGSTITLVIVDSPDYWRPVITPVVEFSPDLIDPTSTAPSFF